MAVNDLTAARLRELLSYDPETGVFIRSSNSRRAKKGDMAGWVNALGYRAVSIQSRTYLCHRLAWLYVTGQWPCGVIDHINGDPGDNRWRNLRDVAHRTNIENQRVAARSNKSTGLLGATLHKASGLYQAQLKTHGKRLGLGYFKTPEEAHAAYLEAKRRLHAGCTI